MIRDDKDRRMDLFLPGTLLSVDLEALKRGGDSGSDDWR